MSAFSSYRPKAAQMSRDELLGRIRALEFTAIDLNLYLDTHPCDGRALCDYNQIATALVQTVTAYEQTYGPLLNYGYGGPCNRWVWAEEPWPWETGC